MRVNPHSQSEKAGQISKNVILRIQFFKKLSMSNEILAIFLKQSF